MFITALAWFTAFALGVPRPTRTANWLATLTLPVLAVSIAAFSALEWPKRLSAMVLVVLMWVAARAWQRLGHLAHSAFYIVFVLGSVTASPSPGGISGTTLLMLGWSSLGILTAHCIAPRMSSRATLLTLCVGLVGSVSLAAI